MDKTDLTSIIVQVVLAIIMLTVALELNYIHVRELPRQWKKLVLGYLMQITFLPVFLIALLLLVQTSTQVTMAFLLLAACPGGNLSQYFTARSQGNISISMGLTFLSTLFSPLTVPGIFFLATHVKTEWMDVYRELYLPWQNILQTLLITLFLPLLIGLWMSTKTSPTWVTLKLRIQKIAPYLLWSLMAGAAWSFRASLILVSFSMVGMVIMISLASLTTSYFFSRLLAHDYTTSITYAWEVSIQNSGLGLVLGMLYFSNVPEVSVICGIWGVWQMFMGMIVSGLLKKHKLKGELICQPTSAG
jgi:bile acid:Na+ symporter, BASS family